MQKVLLSRVVVTEQRRHPSERARCGTLDSGRVIANAVGPGKEHLIEAGAGVRSVEIGGAVAQLHERPDERLVDTVVTEVTRYVLREQLGGFIERTGLAQRPQQPNAHDGDARRVLYYLAEHRGQLVGQTPLLQPQEVELSAIRQHP